MIPTTSLASLSFAALLAATCAQQEQAQSPSQSQSQSNSGQAALPPCILDNCEANATQATGCANDDILCHCNRQDPVYRVVIPCTQKYCADPASSLQKYDELFGAACAQYNISVPAPGIDVSAVINANTTATATLMPTQTQQISTPVPSIYTGSGSAGLDESKLVTLLAGTFIWCGYYAVS